MTLITQCIPCRYGHHERHHEVVQAVPEGVMGGAVCLCKGECESKSRAAPLLAGVERKPNDEED